MIVDMLKMRQVLDLEHLEQLFFSAFTFKYFVPSDFLLLILKEYNRLC